MTLFSVSGRARVTDVKVKSSASAGTEIVVGVAFRRTELTDAERSALMDYYGAFVDVEIAAVQRDPVETPMDRELARVESIDGRDERPRPGPDEHCHECQKVIGDDPDAGFHVPPAGPPSPLCGECFANLEEEEAEEELPADTDPTNQSWCPTCSIWLTVPTGGICEVCGTGTTSSAPVDPPEPKEDWQRIADGEDLELGSSDSSSSSEAPKSEPSDEPIGDGPIPRRPDSEVPVLTTPTRRKS